MRKNLFFFSFIFLIFITGCGNSLDVPKIEGDYDYILKSDDGKLLSQKNIIIKKLSNNKYSINIRQFNSNIGIGNVDVYQEVEILEVKKDHEKFPKAYQIRVKELMAGKGYYERGERVKVEAVKIYVIKFYPKSAVDPKDKIVINTNLKGNPSYTIGFYSYKNN